MKYYVYTLSDSHGPFYVGKGTGKRMYVHKQLALNSNKRHLLYNKIRQLITIGEDIVYEKIFITDNEFEAFEHEIRIISEIGRKDLGMGPLLNLSEGGEGVRGYEFTDEHKSKLSVSLKKSYDDGTCGLHKAHDTIRGSVKGPLSDDHREKLSESGKKFYESEAGRQRKIEESIKRKGHRRELSDEARQKMREGAIRGNKLRHKKD